MIALLVETIRWWLQRFRRPEPPLGPEYFPLPWCDPENQGWCGICGCCLYNCWDFD